MQLRFYLLHCNDFGHFDSFTCWTKWKNHNPLQHKGFSLFPMLNFTDPVLKWYYQCESRVENQRNKGSSNPAEDMKEQARKRTDQAGGLDIGQAVEPVEKTFNGLTDRADEGREGVTRNQDITFALFPRSEQFQGMVFL